MYTCLMHIDLLIFIIFSTAFSCRLFSVLRFESVIHEFDPYFNYRTTKFLAEEGFYSFHNWFDDRAWYPLGRIIGGKSYSSHSYLLLCYSVVYIIFVGLTTLPNIGVLFDWSAVSCKKVKLYFFSKTI